MHILFVGSTSRDSTSVFYYNSLIKMGHHVYAYQPDFFSTSWKNRLSVKLRKRPIQRQIVQSNQTLIEIVRQHHFDLVFVLSEMYLSQQTLRELKSLQRENCRIIFHSHDNIFSPGILKPNTYKDDLLEYDFVFTTKSQNVEKYKKLGQNNAAFVASAYEPSVHYPVPHELSRYAESFGVTFVGTYDSCREAPLESVGWDRLHVWGTGWKKSTQYSRFPSKIHCSAVYAFAYADILSSSQISLGLLREQAQDLHTQRTFEIPACASLQIAPKNDEILSFFDEGKEIVCYTSTEELKDKTDYYLQHTNEQKKIALAGHERCLREGHTYLDRTRQILSITRNTL